MIRPALFAALALAALPVTAQSWKQVPGGANATLAIDTAGIRQEGKWRVFRTRTTALGMEGSIIGIVAMDCAAGVTELRAQRLFAKGKLIRERVFPAAKRPRQKIANPAKDPAFRMVCGR
ncbi:hypothetical protein ABS767_09425 [Sphingomonas sp. ST-64]|uniref:Uncharacterized protein n=1 Tax=Sphingomonas plantiphila TaxID=3163295 RepID=A0ABW8YLM9_9SPHN